ncbi:polymorphic toxin-type HINT domain-containing protein [Acetivibrio clariflavus]|uniref:polymorphic toxin-type HINT domain-containing protein n=1 Tax=Acetivibrio clariflavus TaxID=288965 RepID=UPI0002E117B6|nr:polymorphic toxin-type HINT domain-containing protein [Acetivibrio clariflavus]
MFNRTACFTEETLIYTKDGYKEIKEIQVGDEVYSENPETGEKGLKRVLNVFANEIKELVHLKVGDQKIKTTSTHPFWVEGIGWVDAGELKPGGRLVMYSGEVLEVKEAYVEYLDRPVKVYNFEVEDWHTYFVSEYNVFVHNTVCGDSGVGNKGTSKTAVKIGDDFGKLGKVVENPGLKVDWGQYSKHGLGRMMERNVTTDMVNDWVRNGKVLQQSGGQYLFVTREGAAVVNPNGKLITVMSKYDFDEVMENVVNKLFGN